MYGVPYFADMDFHEAISFLESSHPSRVYQEPLDSPKTTIADYVRRGLLHVDRPGTGRAMHMQGADILLARCLVILSKSGGMPKIMERGLREVVTSFFPDIAREEYAETGKINHHYAVYRFVERGFSDGKYASDGEWELISGDDDIAFPYIFGRKGHHITEAHGDKAAPLWTILDLTDILMDISAKVWANY